MLRIVLFKWLTLASPDVAAPPMVAGLDCAEAGRTTIVAPLGFDRMRVTTAPGEPGASVTVSIAGGDRWASLHAAGGGTSSVTLDPTEVGGTITIAIEPDLDAAVGACVEKIELLRGGEVIGAIIAARPIAAR